jgi:OmpA-OmpF porin, OOP family
MGQNLVPNGSFEKFHQCPDDYNKFPGVFYATDWYNPNAGTPDYFNACSKKCGVPLNWMGNAEAPDGSGYAGIIACMRQVDPNQIAYREYIAVQLISPLEAGKSYFASMQVHLAQSCQTSCNGLGMYFTDKEIQSRGTNNLPFNPQVTPKDIKPIRDKNRWVQINGSFQAEGVENFLIIGNFLSDQQMTFYEFDENFIQTTEIAQYTFFYVDDVKVIELQRDSVLSVQPDIVENIVPFIGQLSQGQKVVLDHLYFATDSSAILAQSFFQLDQLAASMRLKPSVKIIIQGHTDNTGTNEHNLELSESRANEVKKYLISKGISKFRIKAIGFGSSKPVADNLSEEGRAKNRRVEIEVEGL